MARGFLSGALWGVVVASLGAGSASVLNGPVFSPSPNVPESVAGAASAPLAAEPDKLPTAGLGNEASPQSASPGIPEPDSGAEAAEGLADTASTGLPETGDAATLSDAPDDESNAALAALAVDPVATKTPGAQPTLPAKDELSISNNPAQPAAPVPSVDEAVPQLGAVPPEEESAPVAPVAEAPVAVAEEQPDRAEPQTNEDLQANTGEPAAAPDAKESAPVVAAVEPSLSVPPPNPGAEADAPQTAQASQAPPVERDASPDIVATAPPPPAEPQLQPEPVEPQPLPRPQVSELIKKGEVEGRPTVGKPAGTFGNLASSVKTGRLPSLGAEAEVVAEPDRTPLERFAVQTDLEDDKPLMSIVLIDDGSVPMGLEALESFPYPITFAVDTAWQGAGAAMKSYRDAGFEVMALANLPSGARPQDAEVSLSSALSAVPEAVAVLEGDAGGLQESRDVSDQVARILADSGHGLVLYPKGLNTGQAIAARAGVPSATLFRDFDGKGQSATVIRRFLDQAAFKAGQEGAVIMLGRLRPETISALLIWGLQDRASRVAFVPISTVLLTDTDSG